MKDYGKVPVVARFEEEDDDNDWTVPIPEWLTDEFVPSKPVTSDDIFRYQTAGIEPYEGYTKELQDWEDAWQDVARRQAIADGEPFNEQETAW